MCWELTLCLQKRFAPQQLCSLPWPHIPLASSPCCHSSGACCTCTLCFVPTPKDPMLRLILQIGLCKSSFWEQEDLAPCRCRWDLLVILSQVQGRK